jgi:hypothetical protein
MTGENRKAASCRWRCSTHQTVGPGDPAFSFFLPLITVFNFFTQNARGYVDSRIHCHTHPPKLEDSSQCESSSSGRWSDVESMMPVVD